MANTFRVLTHISQRSVPAGSKSAGVTEGAGLSKGMQLSSMQWKLFISRFVALPSDTWPRVERQSRRAREGEGKKRHGSRVQKRVSEGRASGSCAQRSYFSRRAVVVVVSSSSSSSLPRVRTAAYFSGDELLTTLPADAARANKEPKADAKLQWHRTSRATRITRSSARRAVLFGANGASASLPA